MTATGQFLMSLDTYWCLRLGAPKTILYSEVPPGIGKLTASNRAVSLSHLRAPSRSI